MKEQDEKTLVEVLSRLGESVDHIDKKRKQDKWADLAMKIAAAVSTAGIVAVFVLFTTTIPELQNGVDKLSWETNAMKEQLKKIGDEPRFTLKDYNLEERQQRDDLSKVKAMLEVRGSWMSAQDQENVEQEYRIKALEEKVGIKYE